MTKRRRVLSGIVILLLIVLPVVLLFMDPSREKESVSVSLFLKYTEDRVAEQKEETIHTALQEDWIQCEAQLSEQFYQIDAVVLDFTEDEWHEIFVTDHTGEILDSEKVKNGRYTINLPQNAEYVVFSIRKEEKDSLQPQGILTGSEVERKKGNNTPFSGKKLSVLGDSLSALTGYISSEYWSAYPAGEVSTEDMWWYGVAQEMDMEICALNACGGSGVTMRSWANEQGLVPDHGRGQALDAWGEKPDIIIIWLGANDALGGASDLQIRQGFEEILDEVTGAYPAAEIYLCNYYVFHAEYKKVIEDLNYVIAEMGEAYGLDVLELQTCGITAENCARYRIDDVHPNRKGQEMIARELVRQLSSKDGI